MVKRCTRHVAGKPESVDRAGPGVRLVSGEGEDGAVLRVRYDDQIFTLQVRGGISRYFVELLNAFADPALGVSGSTDASWTLNRHLIESGRGRELPGPLARCNRTLQLANRMERLRPSAHDVVHNTYYDRRYLKQTHYRVVTVYDMIPELLPELFPRGNPHADKREFIGAADLVLCISQATRSDLFKVYGIVDAPVLVTPLGVAPGFGSRVERIRTLPQSYILFVGNRSGYKDFWVLAEAFAEADLPADVLLLAVGGGPIRQEEVVRLRQLGLHRRTLHLELDDEELASAYAHALAFVFPSRHEGFGLPTLEAMASGCPTILSSVSSHPEVGGDAARYFPAGDVAELSRSIEELTADEGLRAELGRLGVARAATFTWAETARRTAEAYREHMPGCR